MTDASTLHNGGSAPATPGFTAVAPEWPGYGAADAAPAFPAAESALGSHPCVALSSAQVLPEWINRNPAANAFASNGGNPLNFVSHSRGSVQIPASQRVQGILEMRKGQSTSDWIFPAPTRSGHIEASSIKKQHAAAIQDSDVQLFVLYTLRHTCLTRWQNTWTRSPCTSSPAIRT